jgi:histidinol phosphatase-like enzyme (inositol monophosphatase family)
MSKELVLASAFRAELVFALDLIEEAGQRAVKYFENGVDVDAKEDGSPVTRADKDIEHMIRQAIEQKYPDDGILGEEEIEKKAFLKYQNENGEKMMRRWIVDPIDGTYNFARGIPIFSTLMALEEGDEIVAGVVYNPVFKDMYWAEKGKGAFKNGERIYVSEIDKISEALFNFGGANRIMKEGLWDGFCKLIEMTCRQRGFGDYLGFSYVFEGKAEAMLETGVKPWDLAPMKIIVEEAGGAFVDLAGGHSVYQGGCIVSNKKLAHEFKKILLPKI